MKTLKKIDLNLMQEELEVLNDFEIRTITGGGIDSWFEVQCAAHYVGGSGEDMNLSEDRFNDLSSYAASSGTVRSTGTVTIDGVEYSTKTISFYGTDSDYDYSVGTGQFYYDSSGNCVGFRDRYDFDAQSSGSRPEEAEDDTATGSLLPGQAYNMYYGVGSKDKRPM